MIVEMDLNQRINILCFFVHIIQNILQSVEIRLHQGLLISDSSIKPENSITQNSASSLSNGAELRDQYPNLRLLDQDIQVPVMLQVP
jgi:hypothetical protein